ncbi:DUF4097 family beta strand repeat-containing protein [Streptacidiphilus sp. P02-A3a]|uniref:DUF4097 family beta strand repeat-containing protein n=1 Tax=Streptacidiphilus sp. P02-A3a TaxID=2704468 RepID=UPI0015FAB2A3|nr:DUF4097 family beta strand repeat-containing protein [Streptacidiphilus sp. P02-A3a]QMU70121.1 DUF4097 family beta strand repeat protein [Streptacidiphilus sp. P02-A3a]QMU70426.1 DUF4097 family beta strand repeat protein [Streptacidiphilus sp. P02-A3a]
MSLSTFATPAPIAVALDLYAAGVRFVAADRADTTVEVRPRDPKRAGDVKAAENTRVEYDDETRTLSVITKKPRSRFVNFSNKRPDSIDVVIQLPTDSDVRAEAGLGDFESEGVLGAVALKTDLGAVRLAETGPLNLRSGVGAISVETVNGTAQIHGGSCDIRIVAIDGTADVSTGNGKLWVGLVTGPATVKASNGSVAVDRALSDVTATSANGEVRISEVIRGKVTAGSKNGGVEVGVREGSAAWLELNTGVGRVYNELASAEAPQSGEPVDKVEVHADTKLGDITIRRAPKLDQEA